jgi:Domain of unknown function (DUF4431)
MTRKTQVRLFASLLLLFINSVYASAQKQPCLNYAPEVVQLIGTISKKTFPGPPNYESIRKGDKPETYWVLKLPDTVCTEASGDNDAENSVTDLQLILTQKQYTLYRKFLGRRVNVAGKLSHAQTGHHHTPVLMEVTDISGK